MSLTKKQEAIKKKWLKALRSGKYEQGQETLYDPTTKSFCCLGVLEHCLLDGKVENEWDPENEGVSDTQVFANYPSPQFYEAFKLDWVEQNQSKLANMNDGHYDWVIKNGYQDPKDFNEIADHIEKNWV